MTATILVTIFAENQNKSIFISILDPPIDVYVAKAA